MNPLHTLLQQTPRAEVYPLLTGLPEVFPQKHEMAYNRLSQADRAELAQLRKADYETLTDALEGFLGYVGVPLEEMSKRQWTVFRWMHRFWLKAAKKYTTTLVTWGVEATERTADGVLCYRTSGGNINESVYARTGAITLKRVLECSSLVLSQVLGYHEESLGLSEALARATAESERVIVEHLRKRRAYLKAFDGRLTKPIQELVDSFRSYVFYESVGDVEADCLGSNPAGKWDLEQYYLDKLVDENDYDSQSEDDYED